MTNRASRRVSRRPGLWSGVVSSGLMCLLIAAPFPVLAQQDSRISSSGLLMLGSVSAVGSVELRGVPISRLGTLFDGDRIETSGDAYVRVQLLGGSQLELGDDTEVEIKFDESTVQIEMNRGTVAFSSWEASRPISVSIDSFRIDGTEGAAAEVAFLAPNRLSVTALAESLSVTQVVEQETEPVAEGEQVIIDLDAAIEPTETPPEAPQPVASTEPAGDSSAKWVLIGAGVGGGTGAGIFLATKGNSTASQSQP